MKYQYQHVILKIFYLWLWNIWPILLVAKLLSFKWQSVCLYVESFRGETWFYLLIFKIKCLKIKIDSVFFWFFKILHISVHIYYITFLVCRSVMIIPYVSCFYGVLNYALFPFITATLSLQAILVRSIILNFQITCIISTPLECINLMLNSHQYRKT